MDKYIITLLTQATSSLASSQQTSPIFQRQATNRTVLQPTQVISTANAATVCFLLFALALGAIALAFGVTAWQNTNHIYATRKAAGQTLRVETVSDNVVVQNDPSTAQSISLLFNVSQSNANYQNLITGVYLRSTDGTIISDYPFIYQAGQIRLTLPTTLAETSDIIIPNLLNSTQRTTGYIFNSEVWTIVIAYRVPPSTTVTY